MKNREPLRTGSVPGGSAPRRAACPIASAGAAAVLLFCGSARAAIIGNHDLSDPVKTAGWVCATESVAPVRVHLYAETPSGLTLLDSQWADKRRDDLQSVCGDVNHAFRFADYATTSDGVALYKMRLPVPMHVYFESPTGLQPVNGSPRSVSFLPVGIWDAKLKVGRWRTDFSNPDEGTAKAPLLTGECPFATPKSDGYFAFSGGGPDPLTRCRYGRTISPRSNAASSDGTWPASSFWAVVANVEAAIDNPLCVDGPPGQSKPIGPPGAGEVFGLVALPDVETGNPDRLKMHMVINSQNWTGCRSGSYGGPYLAFGAHAERGNNGVLTYLNMPGAATTLRFGMTLMDIANLRPQFHGVPQDAKRYSQGHVLIEIMWGGVKRSLFIELVPDVRAVSGTAEGSIDVHVRFNWHMVNSMLHPGADYLYKSGTVLSAQCRQDGVVIPVLDRAATYVNPETRDRSRRDYKINIQRVFNCLNRIGAWGDAPMPAHPVPVTSIMFGMEQDDRVYLNGAFIGVTSPNAQWIAIDSVRLE
jgi:hypothetical protein